jgi:cytochrome c oxidase subunit 1
MLSAKLFAALAILQLGLALIEGRTSPGSMDVYLHGTYFVVAHIHLQIWWGLTSLCFALIYFGVFRWSRHPLNDSLGLTHFVMATIGFVLLSVSLLSMSRRASMSEATHHWIGLAVLVGVLSFFFGCATLAVNFVWTAITASRSH